VLFFSSTVTECPAFAAKLADANPEKPLPMMVIFDMIKD
jgi:hypothetical protein